MVPIPWLWAWVAHLACARWQARLLQPRKLLRPRKTRVAGHRWRLVRPWLLWMLRAVVRTQRRALCAYLQLAAGTVGLFFFLAVATAFLSFIRRAGEGWALEDRSHLDSWSIVYSFWYVVLIQTARTHGYTILFDFDDSNTPCSPHGFHSAATIQFCLKAGYWHIDTH